MGLSIDLNLSVLIPLIAVFSACVGSFLNVVIYRLPGMLAWQWENPTSQDAPPINLLTPRSHCPNCKQMIPFFLNIPILGYFIAKRQCYFCAYKIPLIYPLLECSTGLLAAWITYRFGMSWQTFAALIFTWMLIPLIFIDMKHQLLPDILTIPGIWLGLLCNFFHLFVSLDDAFLGAILGYISLWLIAQLFKQLKKREGMGHGDFKLFAMLGAWQGFEILPYILFQASFVGILISLTRILFKKQNINAPIPFGPYLAISGWVIFLYSDVFLNFYQILFSTLIRNH